MIPASSIISSKCPDNTALVDEHCLLNTCPVYPVGKEATRLKGTSMSTWVRINYFHFYTGEDRFNGPGDPPRQYLTEMPRDGIETFQINANTLILISALSVLALMFKCAYWR
ncbi:unnamed protein product [Periconia digitata]|uniref:Uncharacterized protein n=1 Tax=Periconia digitata TaxID=1303443 RepID=A0A9W4US93_9PLEO|nr:unnamed protein product [Periconia digitata]